MNKKKKEKVRQEKKYGLRKMKRSTSNDFCCIVGYRKWVSKRKREQGKKRGKY